MTEPGKSNLELRAMCQATVEQAADGPFRVLSMVQAEGIADRVDHAIRRDISELGKEVIEAKDAGPAIERAWDILTTEDRNEAYLKAIIPGALCQATEDVLDAAELEQPELRSDLPFVYERERKEWRDTFESHHDMLSWQLLERLQADKQWERVVALLQRCPKLCSQREYIVRDLFEDEQYETAIEVYTMYGKRPAIPIECKIAGMLAKSLAGAGRLKELEELAVSFRSSVHGPKAVKAMVEAVSAAGISPEAQQTAITIAERLAGTTLLSTIALNNLGRRNDCRIALEAIDRSERCANPSWRSGRYEHITNWAQLVITEGNRRPIKVDYFKGDWVVTRAKPGQKRACAYTRAADIERGSDDPAVQRALAVTLIEFGEQSGCLQQPPTQPAAPDESNESNVQQPERHRIPWVS